MPQLPDISSSDYDRYKELVPEFDQPMSKRAAEALNRLAYGAAGEALPENEVERNIAMFQEEIRVKIAQLEPNLIWRGKLHPVREGRNEIYMGSSDAEFKKAPRTDLKTFEEILADPTERMGLDSGNRFATAHCIVVSPKRIKDSLLENLGLTEFLPPKRTKKDEKQAYRAQAIPAIKEMLEHLDTFALSHEQDRSSLRYFRLFRINAGKNLGKVLGTQVIGKQKTLFLTDLHGAHRRIDHIYDGYDQEIAVLQQIQDGVRDVDVKLSREWKQTKDEGKVEEVKQQLLALVDQLQFVTNEHKQKMRDQIRGAVNLESVYTLPEKRKMIKGVSTVVRPAKTVVALNPGAARARINTSPLHVGRRIAEIAAIKSYLAKDQTRIKTFIEAQSQPFDEFHKTVEEMHAKLNILQQDRPMTPAERLRAINNLERFRNKCSFSTSPIMFFEPYQTFAQVMVEYIDRTVEALRKDETPENRKEAAEEFTKVYLVTKIQRFHSQMQALYDEFLSGGKVPDFDKFLEKLGAIDLVLYRKDIAPQVKTAEFDPVFGELYHLINSVRSRAKKAKEIVNTAPESEEIKILTNFIYERIRSFDFATLMGKISVQDGAVLDNLEGTSGDSL